MATTTTDPAAAAVARLLAIVADAASQLDQAYRLAGPELQLRMDADPVLAGLNATDLRAAARTYGAAAPA